MRTVELQHRICYCVYYVTAGITNFFLRGVFHPGVWNLPVTQLQHISKVDLNNYKWENRCVFTFFFVTGENIFSGYNSYKKIVFLISNFWLDLKSFQNNVKKKFVKSAVTLYTPGSWRWL